MDFGDPVLVPSQAMAGCLWMGGKEEVKSEHLDLPPDLVNGLVLSIAKNIRPDTPETKVPMVVATPKLLC
jgi:hypothetical protein